MRFRLFVLTLTFMLGCSAGDGQQDAGVSGASAGGHGGDSEMVSGGAGGANTGSVGGAGSAGSAGTTASSGGAGATNGTAHDADSGIQQPTTDAATDGGGPGTGLVRNTGWADACADVTAVGHCVGNVLEWCDYFTRGLQQLDCGAHGMTCHAALMSNIDDEGSGCVGGSCEKSDEHCDADLAFRCRQGTMFASTCRRSGGASAECEIYDEGDSARPACPSAVPCMPEFDRWCDGTTQVQCTADGLRIQDCRSRHLDGECKVIDDAYAQCDPL